MATLWEKIQFWKKKSMKPEIDIDYTIVDSDDGKKTGIGILKGKYAGVLYHYGMARIVEEELVAKMQFDYTIVTSPSIPFDDLMEDQEFHTMIGDILTEILMSKEENETIRDNDIKEFDI